MRPGARRGPLHGGAGPRALALVAWLALVLAAVPARAHPAVCRVGAYVTGLSSINFGNQEVHLDAYVWVKCPSVVPVEDMRLAVVGANEEDRSEEFVEETNGVRYRYERIRATLRVPLSLRRYPFDTQRVTIDLEAARATADEVRFALDDDPVMGARPCCLDEAVAIPDWRIVSAEPRADVRRFRTRFGYTTEGDHAYSYPRFRVEIALRREVRPYLWKVLLPLMIILAMALASSYWPVGNLDVTSNVLIAALLSVVAAHLTQRSELPNTGYLVAGDGFFIHAYLMLLLMLVAASAAHHLHAIGRDDDARRLQRWERRLVPAIVAAGWGLVAALG